MSHHVDWEGGPPARYARALAGSPGQVSRPWYRQLGGTFSSLSTPLPTDMSTMPGLSPYGLPVRTLPAPVCAPPEELYTQLHLRYSTAPGTCLAVMRSTRLSSRRWCAHGHGRTLTGRQRGMAGRRFALRQRCCIVTDATYPGSANARTASMAMVKHGVAPVTTKPKNFPKNVALRAPFCYSLCTDSGESIPPVMLSACPAVSPL